MLNIKFNIFQILFNSVKMLLIYFINNKFEFIKSWYIIRIDKEYRQYRIIIQKYNFLDFLED